jgi:hypothetical protein
LTRHQNHHTGTVEEAAAATAAALASRQNMANPRSTRSEADEYSETQSPMPTPSPNERPMSMSPAGGMSVVPQMHRQTSDYNYMGAMNVPPHLRSEMPQQSPRSSPSLSQSYSSGMSTAGRPSLTSHPSGYGPPSTLEPPANSNHGQQNSSTPSGSPHMANMGWQSPSAHALQSPGPGDNFIYPEPNQYQSAGNMYYSNNIRRPTSTEPTQYDHGQQRLSNDMWAAAPVQ